MRIAILIRLPLARSACRVACDSRFNSGCKHNVGDACNKPCIGAYLALHMQNGGYLDRE